MIRVVDTSKFTDIEYPKELEGSWFFYVLFENHPNSNIRGIGGVYFNDKYPSGTLCISDHILNDYPDGYCIFGKDDGTGNASTGRVFVSPHLRQKGIASSGIAYGITMIKHLFKQTIVHSGGNEFGNKAFANAAKMVNHPYEDAKPEEGFHMQDKYFEQPVYPYVFFGRRVAE